MLLGFTWYCLQHFCQTSSCVRERDAKSSCTKMRAVLHHNTAALRLPRSIAMLACFGLIKYGNLCARSKAITSTSSFSQHCANSFSDAGVTAMTSNCFAAGELPFCVCECVRISVSEGGGMEEEQINKYSRKYSMYESRRKPGMHTAMLAQDTCGTPRLQQPLSKSRVYCVYSIVRCLVLVARAGSQNTNKS